MFVNSLFKDYLTENGLKIWNEESTRDLICLEFNYGTRDFEEEMAHLEKISLAARDEYKIAKSHKKKVVIDKKANKRKKLAALHQEAIKNKDKYEKLSKEDIRKLYYTNGCDVEYLTRNKKGEIIKRENIHYKMLYRSTGKAKKGSCVFIRDKLYAKAIRWLRMGLKLPKHNAPIVEMSAYSPLTASGIESKIRINPKNILVLEDIDKFFTTNVISIETNELKQCQAIHRDNYKLKNTLFDGQALIDSSIFPDWGNGYILLRHHFCKMAAFSSNIQKFFRDYFRDEYETATVKDMFGNEHFVKDIELITTDNAMKWLKMGSTYDYWCEWVEKNDCMFGIVKTAHESKLGDMQRMSYQMVNALDLSTMENVVINTVEFVTRLKTDEYAFLDFLEKNKNFSNDYEVLIALCKHNPEFIKSKYFRDRKKRIIEAYVFNVKNGRLLQNADNLVIVGSPYAMLLYGATGNKDIVDNDDTFCTEEGTIQCYTGRFSDNEYLAAFRSPFNSKNNLTSLHNVYDYRFEKYFNLGKQCIAINMIGTSFQEKNNGFL